MKGAQHPTHHGVKHVVQIGVSCVRGIRGRTATPMELQKSKNTPRARVVGPFVSMSVFFPRIDLKNDRNKENESPATENHVQTKDHSIPNTFSTCLQVLRKCGVDRCGRACCWQVLPECCVERRAKSRLAGEWHAGVWWSVAEK